MPEERREMLLQEHARAWAIACDDRFTKKYKEEHLRIAREIERELRIPGKAYNG